MKVIVITGGIGAGKSLVSKELLKYNGIIVLFTDDIAKEQMKKGGISYNQVVDRFGSKILDKDGEIDKKILSKIVFSDEKKKLELNEITHPNVRKFILDKIEKAGCDKSIRASFIETALYIEAGYSDFTDEVWYIKAPVEQRIQRLISSRGYSKEKVISIINSQKGEDEFLEYADYVIENTDGADVNKLIKKAIKERL